MDCLRAGHVWADQPIKSRLVVTSTCFGQQHFDTAARNFGSRAIHNFQTWCDEQEASKRFEREVFLADHCY
jgi:hypothetical protein